MKNKNTRKYRPIYQLMKSGHKQQTKRDLLIELMFRLQFSKVEEVVSIFDHDLDSLCGGSPRINNESQFIEKYRTYIQFVSTGKRNTGDYHDIKRHSHIITNNKKGGSATPTPKRTSPLFQPNEKVRKSSYEKLHQPLGTKGNHSFGYYENQHIIKIHKPQPTSKDKLFVKGKLIKSNPHALKQRDDSKLQNSYHNSNRIPTANSRKEKKNQDNNLKQQKKKSVLNKTLANENEIELQQQKLIAKLFKGIEFHRDLGRGAHALVKSAVDWNKKRKIAIKVYQKSELTQDELLSIQRQIQILMSLNHQHIVRLYEIIETYKTINLMMEYGGGNSLQQYMRSRPEGRLNQSQGRQIFYQVCETVAYLHQADIAHRDLKTQNILLNKHLQLKIIDFGFSIICPPQKTIASYCGTPTYMAPEVVKKTPHNPLLSDRWSLGILLFTILNGHCPFKAPTQKELFKKIVDGQFQYIAELSTEAKELIEAFLKRNPSQRITAAQALKSKWLTCRSLPNSETLIQKNI